MMAYHENCQKEYDRWCEKCGKYEMSGDCDG